MTKRQLRKRVYQAIARALESKVRVREGDELINALGFDSLRLAVLAIELEKELGQPVLLAVWASRVSDPKQLTVGSLCAYLWQVLDHDA